LLTGVDLTGIGLLAATGLRARIAATPLATVTELIFETFGRRKGSPSQWLARLRTAFGTSEVATGALAPVCGPDGPPFIPDCLLPRPEAPFPSFADELDRVAAVSSADLMAELETAEFRRSAWSVVAEAPDRWLDAYLVALRIAWECIQPWWERATPLLEREAERMGAALAWGSLGEQLAQLYPDRRISDDSGRHRPWYSPTALAPDLVLAPMVVGPGGSLVGTEGDRIHYLGYPLPGAHRLIAGTGPHSNATPLDELLGAPRADILRRLDRPMSAGGLADELLFTPSAISHHLKALERTGLVVRERNGQRVVVHRSARGTALLFIYEAWGRTAKRRTTQRHVSPQFH
jgi:DNA-binding transcriptional ArsR family regulator